MAVITNLGFNIFARDNTRNALKNAGAGFGKFAQNVAKVVALAPTGGAAVSVLAAGAGAAAAAFTAAGVGLALFAAAVKPQFKLIQDASTHYTQAQVKQQKAELATAHAHDLAAKGGKEYKKALAQAKTATDAAKRSSNLYKDDLAGMSPATRDTANAFQTFKDVLAGWSAKLSANTMPLFTKGLNALTLALPLTEGLVKTTAHAISGLMDSMAHGVKSGGLKAFLDKMDQSAKVVLPDLLASIKNVVAGFGGIINAFMPMSGNFSGGLEKITAAFARWGQGLAKSEGFHKFMAYVRASGPKLLDILKTAAEAVGNIVMALAPFTGASLLLSKALAAIIANTPSKVLSVLAGIITTVVIAQKLWILYSGIASAAAWLFAARVDATTGATIASRAALIGARIAMVASTVATWAVTAATWAWSAAINSTGLPLLIIGIAALVAAIIYVAVKTTWFQTAWKYTWNAIKLAASVVWNTTLKPIFNALMVAFRAVAAVALWFYKNIMHPIWTALLFVVKIWWWGVKVYFALWVAAIKGLANLAVWFYKKAIKPAFDGIATAAKFLYRNGIKPAFSAIVISLKTVATWAKWLWDKGIKPWFNSIISGAKNVGSWFKWLYEKGIAPQMRSVGNIVKTVWNGTIRVVFNALKRGVSAVKSAFGTAVKGIGTAWNTLKAVTKAPVKFFVNTVYNNGLRKAWNSTAGKISGVPDMAQARLPFARGGPIRGAGGPTADKVPLWGSAGEFMVRAKRVRELGLPFMHWVNNGQGGPSPDMGFALGGLLPNPMDIVKGAVKGLGKGFNWATDFTRGIAGKALSQLFKPIRAVTNGITGHFPKSGIVGTFIKNFANSGYDKLISFVKGKAKADEDTGNANYKPGAGVRQWANVTKSMLAAVGQPTGTDWVNMVLRRMNQESGGNPNIVNKWDSNWTAGHPSVGLMQVIKGTFQHYAGKYRNKGPMKYGVSVDPAANIYSSMKYALGAYGSLPRAYNRAGGYAAGGPVLSFDEGGMLPAGLNAVFNGTGKPEPLKRDNGGGDIIFQRGAFDGALFAGTARQFEDMLVTATRNAKKKGRL